MIFPLISYELISPWLNWLFAVFIGMAFGFILEKGGLGDAKKLIGQFLLKDLAVFKVMFSAIITAMFGLFFLNAFDLINLELISFADSYVLPQIAGGLILGVGFAITGYCPGTTIVGMASGKIDAIYSFVGLFVGSWLFVEIYNWIATFYLSTHINQDRLFDLFSIPYGTLVLLVASIAIVGFIAAEKIEKLHE